MAEQSLFHFGIIFFCFANEQYTPILKYKTPETSLLMPLVGRSNVILIDNDNGKHWWNFFISLRETVAFSLMTQHFKDIVNGMEYFTNFKVTCSHFSRGVLSRGARGAPHLGSKTYRAAEIFEAFFFYYCYPFEILRCALKPPGVEPCPPLLLRQW